MTQKELIESVLKEIQHVKNNMPNGELKQMGIDVNHLKENMSQLKNTLLNPDSGVIVNTNKNTEFREMLQLNEKDFIAKMQALESIKSWRDGVTKALWIIFGSLVAIVVRMLMMHKGLG